jgi:GPH family glycoside/pentoside/hexuronide:cation symporter
LNAIVFFNIFGGCAVGSLGGYVNIYYVCDGNLNTAGTVSGVKGTALAITAIAGIPLFTWLGEKFDKKTVLGWMIGITTFGHAWSYFLTTPKYPYLTLISGIFECGAASSFWLYLPSMLADTADYDELTTGCRREGGINAFFSWFVKAAIAISAGISGIVLAKCGFNINHVGPQSPQVLHTMLLVFSTFPVLVWAIALLFVWLYPLDRATMKNIRIELQARRGEV